MKLIIEWDGPLFDVAGAYHEAHRQAARDVGWSQLDRVTFWRTLRKAGRGGRFLPGAKPAMDKRYQARFDELLEQTAVVALCTPCEGLADTIKRLQSHATLAIVSLGSNASARRTELNRVERGGTPLDIAALNSDPRRRPGELRILAGDETRTVVVAATDTLARAASHAELFSLGMSNGPCSAPLLHRAGADIVLSDLSSLAQCLDGGAQELTQAGLLPLPLGCPPQCNP